MKLTADQFVYKITPTHTELRRGDNSFKDASRESWISYCFDQGICPNCSRECFVPTSMPEPVNKRSTCTKCGFVMGGNFGSKELHSRWDLLEDMR